MNKAMALVWSEAVGVLGSIFWYVLMVEKEVTGMAGRRDIHPAGGISAQERDARSLSASDHTGEKNEEMSKKNVSVLKLIGLQYTN